MNLPFAPTLPRLVRFSLASKKAARSKKLADLASGRDAQCSSCFGPRDCWYDRYCYDCRVAYMRSWKTSRETLRETIVLPPTREWLPSARGAA